MSTVTQLFASTHGNHLPDDREWLTSPEVVSATGCTYRQLDFWSRTRRIRPADGDGHGSGYLRRWDKSEVQVIRLAVQLLDLKLSLDAALDYARRLAADGMVFEHCEGVHLILHVPSEAS